MSIEKFLISGTGCALADYLYSEISFSSSSFSKYLSVKPGDGGISPGRLVFTEELEKFSGQPYEKILDDITGGKDPDGINIGGPGLVSMINVAQLLDEDDFSVRFYGRPGRDKTSEMIISRAGSTPLDISGYLPLSQKPTPFTDVFSDPWFDGGNGERTFVNNIGAAWDYVPEMIPEEFFKSEIICFGGTALVPYIHDSLWDLLLKGKRNNCITIVNTVFDFRNEKADPGAPWPLVKDETGYTLIDVLITDHEEAIKISGQSSSLKAAEFFIRKGVSSVFITNGPKDIIAFSNGSLFEESGLINFPVSRLVTDEMRRSGDTTGCGDNFAGGIIASVASQKRIHKDKKLSIEEAVSLAVASGGFACSYLGGSFTENFKKEKWGLICEFVKDYRKQLKD